MIEYEVEALFDTFRRRGAAARPTHHRRLGPERGVLHYRNNDRASRRASCCSSMPAASTATTPPTSRARFPIGARSRRRSGPSTSSCSTAQLEAIEAIRPGSALRRSARRGAASAGRRDAATSVCSRARRRKSSRAVHIAVLHASDQPLARHGRARRRQSIGRARSRARSSRAWC